MRNRLRLKIPLGFYFASIFSLFLYSFTQIDLSLTFSRITILRNLVGSFQYVGYFQRPLSTYIYLGIIALLFGFYLYFIKLAHQKKISSKYIWKVIIAASAILVFSYNAFSYDLFNYIFDAKIYTHYHLNPYLHKALDFPGDSMLSFMRWTHRVYPYGPVWLFLTIPLSYIGMNFFLPTFFLFKLLIATSFLGSLYFISKIFRKIAPDKEALGLIVFGLNPLVLIESLVSGHLDIVMIFFALWATNKLIEKKYLVAVILLLISIGIKFGTVFLIPVFLVVFLMQRKNKKINWRIPFGLGIFLLMLTVIVSSIYSGNFQPWYLILPFSYAIFLADKYYIYIPGGVFSIFALLTYSPYLYFGNWDLPVPVILSAIYIAGTSISVLGVVIYSINIYLRNKR